MKIAMIVANRVAPDPRVVREANILNDLGHTLMFFGLDYGNDAPAHSNVPGEIKLAQVPKLSQMTSSLAKTSQRQQKRSVFAELLRKLGRNLFVANQFRATLKGLNQHILPIRGFAPDVIHAHDLNALPTAVEAAEACGAKLIYDSHELFSEMGSYHQIYKRYLTNIERKCLRKVDATITVSNLVAKTLSEKYNIRNITLFRNIPKGIPHSNNGLNTPISFLYHGSISPNRGVEEIVDAFSIIPKEVPCRLKIRGFGTVLSVLGKKIRENGMAGRIVLEPPIPPENVVSEASREDVGIIAFRPSSLNNMFALPNKYFEYLLAGLCILTNNELPELKDTISKHRSGFLFNNTSSQSIASRVQDLVATPEKIRLAKENSYRVASDECNLHNESKRLISVYESLFTASMAKSG